MKLWSAGSLFIKPKSFSSLHMAQTPVCDLIYLVLKVLNPHLPPGYVDPLQMLGDVIAQLDAVVSFAVASVSAPVPYVRPRLLDESCRRMELLQARHPCMETDADTAFIPNDITFVQGEKSFYIITGERRRRGLNL